MSAKPEALPQMPQGMQSQTESLNKKQEKIYIY